ncbi:RING-H2 finger protein ATL72 [Vitis vinifera]|uniref:RING-type E3 ubiquitin transferase n=2 Tax=Vitis vinifera TaxID=29760 RepID=A0A438KP08_VITVI|nr:RING-H2 finger protein ATL72 [Vitis vinifera]
METKPRHTIEKQIKTFHLSINSKVLEILRPTGARSHDPMMFFLCSLLSPPIQSPINVMSGNGPQYERLAYVMELEWTKLDPIGSSPPTRGSTSKLVKVTHKHHEVLVPFQFFHANIHQMTVARKISRVSDLIRTFTLKWGHHGRQVFDRSTGIRFHNHTTAAPFLEMAYCLSYGQLLREVERYQNFSLLLLPQKSLESAGDNRKKIFALQGDRISATEGGCGLSTMAWNLYAGPRRLLLDTETAMPPMNGSRGSSSYANDANFDSNMVIILAALLCALICALGLNSIVRCALRCSNRFSLETPDQVAAHLATTGLEKGTLSQIPVVVYGSSGLTTPATDCPICLGEFTEGDKVRILPKCNHGFHVKCIDTWLMSRSSCPTCRQPLLEHPTNSNGEELVVRIL